MGKFEFKKNVIQFEIEGKVYEVPGDLAFAEKMMANGEKLQKLSETIEPDVNALDNLTDILLEIFEDLLGEDAVESIFETKEPDFFSCLDLFDFISTEVNEYAEKRVNTLHMLSQKHSGATPVENRETRRSKNYKRRDPR